MPTEPEMQAAIQEALRVQQQQFDAKLEAQKQLLEGLIQNGPRQPRLPQIHPIGGQIPVPTYDPNMMTANSYLLEVERYFQSQGFTDDQRLYLVNSIVSTDVQAWLQHVKRQNPNLDWDEFKKQFCDKYDTWFHKHQRMTKLQTRRQRDDENFESYIWEIVRLSSQVFPTEPLEDTIRRCRQGLLPKLRAAIGELTVWTPEHLIERCNTMWLDLMANERKESFRFNSKNNGFQKNTFSNSHLHNSQNPHPYPRNDNGRFNPLKSNSQRNGEAHLHNGNGTKGKQPFHSRHEGNPHAHLTCNKCKKKGHIARFCREGHTAMLAHGSNDYDNHCQSTIVPNRNTNENANPLNN